ncbi:MAG TPA: LysR family transcriptional regulator [Paenalcaligenes sp.]|nr:LysR family transcriptional regulator [Paenalcaligenes sp.]
MQALALKYFYKVALRGSMSGAADDLDIAVSAVSRQIDNLEDRVGARLFDRSVQGMQLTPAGEVLLAHVRRMRLETESTLQEIESLSQAINRPIRVACTQGVANDLIPGLMAEFRQTHPQVRFNLIVSSAPRATQQVVTGAADIAVTFSTRREAQVAVRFTCRAPALAVMAVGHPLGRRRRLSLNDVQDFPIVLTDTGTSTYKLYQQACNMTGRWVEPVLYCNHAQALHSYVRLSHAVLFASYVSVGRRLKGSGLLARPLLNPEMHARMVQVQVMQGRQLPRLMEDFIAVVVHSINEINKDAPR